MKLPTTILFHFIATSKSTAPKPVGAEGDDFKLDANPVGPDERDGRSGFGGGGSELPPPKSGKVGREGGFDVTLFLAGGGGGPAANHLPEGEAGGTRWWHWWAVFLERDGGCGFQKKANWMMRITVGWVARGGVGPFDDPPGLAEPGVAVRLKQDSLEEVEVELRVTTQKLWGELAE
ncbi:hypothetical protein BC829DRAFT_428974 [Chytridium lagenaria]|nr:hypothetical protein BC829DRAFT_428974 [Chytridium lagenaria]